MMRSQRRLLIGLIVLALCTPLGIILPARFNAGNAWGEWSSDALARLLGYMPEGLKKYSQLWKAPVSGYSFGKENGPVDHQILSYVASGFLGVIIVALILYALSRFLVKNGK